MVAAVRLKKPITIFQVVLHGFTTDCLEIEPNIDLSYWCAFSIFTSLSVPIKFLGSASLILFKYTNLTK